MYVMVKEIHNAFKTSQIAAIIRDKDFYKEYNIVNNIMDYLVNVAYSEEFRSVSILGSQYYNESNIKYIISKYGDIISKYTKHNITFINGSTIKSVNNPVGYRSDLIYINYFSMGYDLNGFVYNTLNSLELNGKLLLDNVSYLDNNYIHELSLIKDCKKVLLCDDLTIDKLKSMSNILTKQELNIETLKLI